MAGPEVAVLVILILAVCWIVRVGTRWVCL